MRHTTHFYVMVASVLILLQGMRSEQAICERKRKSPTKMDGDRRHTSCPQSRLQQLYMSDTIVTTPGVRDRVASEYQRIQTQNKRELSTQHTSYQIVTNTESVRRERDTRRNERRITRVDQGTLARKSAVRHTNEDSRRERSIGNEDSNIIFARQHERNTVRQENTRRDNIMRNRQNRQVRNERCTRIITRRTVREESIPDTTQNNSDRRIQIFLIYTDLKAKTRRNEYYARNDDRMATSRIKRNTENGHIRIINKHQMSERQNRNVSVNKDVRLTDIRDNRNAQTNLQDRRSSTIRIPYSDVRQVEVRIISAKRENTISRKESDIRLDRLILTDQTNRYEIRETDSANRVKNTRKQTTRGLTRRDGRINTVLANDQLKKHDNENNSKRTIMRVKENDDGRERVVSERNRNRHSVIRRRVGLNSRQIDNSDTRKNENKYRERISENTRETSRTRASLIIDSQASAHNERQRIANGRLSDQQEHRLTRANIVTNAKRNVREEVTENALPLKRLLAGSNSQSDIHSFQKGVSNLGNGMYGVCKDIVTSTFTFDGLSVSRAILVGFVGTLGRSLWQKQL